MTILCLDNNGLAKFYIGNLILYDLFFVAVSHQRRWAMRRNRGIGVVRTIHSEVHKYPVLLFAPLNQGGSFAGSQTLSMFLPQTWSVLALSPIQNIFTPCLHSWLLASFRKPTLTTCLWRAPHLLDFLTLLLCLLILPHVYLQYLSLSTCSLVYYLSPTLKCKLSEDRNFFLYYYIPVLE